MSQRTYYSEEAKHRANIQRTAVIAICLALGASIGTAIAVLFAPQSGEETRKELGEASGSAIEKLQHQVDELRKRFEEMTH